jgi:hypothetical protein
MAHTRGPQSTEQTPTASGQESVDLRDTGVTAYVGHGESRAGDAGHEAMWGASSPSFDDDARWVDGSAAW